MDALKSSGKCLFCNKEFSKTSMSRHLGGHLSEKSREGAQGRSFHIKIETDSRYGSAPYFLNLWIDGSSSFDDLDSFLREIWLECCGHMSAFTNPAQKKRGGMWSFFEAENLLESGEMEAYEKMMEEENGEIPKSRDIDDVLTKDLKLKYEYDFGSTTPLQVTVINEYPVSIKGEIILLSRNEPLEILCGMCGKHGATQICTVCMGEEESAFCDACAKKHAKTCADFAEYAAMPVVNSPRMGVCAYMGGSIDKERDGAYVKR